MNVLHNAALEGQQHLYLNCILYILDRCSTSGGEPEDACMKFIVRYVIAEAVKNLLQPMPQLLA